MPRDATATGHLPHRTALLEEIFRQSPAFLHVPRGPEFVFEFANEAYYQLVGRRDLIGRPAFEVMPEAAAGGYPERIARVMTTGEPFVEHELPVTLARTPTSRSSIPTAPAPACSPTGPTSPTRS